MGQTDYATFSYLSAGNAAFHRLVMLQFVRAKNRFIVHLRPEEVWAEIVTDGNEADLADVTQSLNSLTQWGNLMADPDTARVTTVEDFHRARYLYQLSPAGETTERALTHFDETLGRRGSLQAAALTDIANDLRALLELARNPAPDAAKVHPVLLALVRRFSDLADNAQAFVGSLQRAIELNGVDAEAFLAYKDHLIGYLERFVHDLVTTGSEIAQLIDDLEAAGIDPLLQVAAERETADTAPEMLPAVDDSAAADAVLAAVAHLEVWHERWIGFRRWFVSEAGHESQQKLLRSRARAAIPQLLQVVRALNERRSGRSDRSADLVRLALWFAEAPDDAARHVLWRVAFGLAPARHLSIDADTLDDRRDNPVSPSTPWNGAPPLLVSPRLRATGSYERRGKPATVSDRSVQRRHLAELVARQNADIAAARHQLVTDGPILLSELRMLDEHAFELFLRLIGDALGQRAPGRLDTVSARSIDGSLELRLTPLRSAGQVEFHSSTGTLRGPEHRIDILDTLVVS